MLGSLEPLHFDVRVHDPSIPKETADISGFLLTNLDFVLSDSDVVGLAPLTSRTYRTIGKRQLDLLPVGGALVNVSRGRSSAWTR